MHHIGKDLSYSKHSVDFTSIKLLDGFMALSCRMCWVIMVIFIPCLIYYFMLFLLLLLTYLFDIFSFCLGWRHSHQYLY